MTKLDTCKKCTNRKFDRNKGLVCGLTDNKPDFELECAHFIRDEKIKETPKEKARPNFQRGKIAYLLVGLVTLFQIVSLASEYLQYSLLKTVEAGAQITEELATKNDSRQQIVAVVFLLSYVISAITFLFWFRRAYFNLKQRVKHTSFTEGWSVGCWFVPVISLYRPYQIMREMWVTTVKLNKNADSSFYESSLDKIIIWWWVLWILLSYIGNFIMKAGFRAETIAEINNASLATMISSVLSIPMGIFLIVIIKEYSEMEEKLRLIEIEHR